MKIQSLTSGFSEWFVVHTYTANGDKFPFLLMKKVMQSQYIYSVSVAEITYGYIYVEWEKYISDFFHIGRL